jgi:hypothetical protein
VVRAARVTVVVGSVRAFAVRRLAVGVPRAIAFSFARRLVVPGGIRVPSRGSA